MASLPPCFLFPGLLFPSCCCGINHRKRLVVTVDEASTFYRSAYPSNCGQKQRSVLLLSTVAAVSTGATHRAEFSFSFFHELLSTDIGVHVGAGRSRSLRCRKPGSQLLTFRFSGRRGSSPIRLAINDELMSPMTETIQCALTEKGLIENSHPFLDATIGRDNRGRSRVAFHNQVIEI